MKKAPTEKQVYALQAAGKNLEAWQASLERLTDEPLTEEKYHLWLDVLNDPFAVLDTADDVLDFLEFAARIFGERYDRGVGDQRQNATCEYVAGTVHNMILERLKT